MTIFEYDFDANDGLVMAAEIHGETVHLKPPSNDPDDRYHFTARLVDVRHCGALEVRDRGLRRYNAIVQLPFGLSDGDNVYISEHPDGPTGGTRFSASPYRGEYKYVVRGSDLVYED